MGTVTFLHVTREAFRNTETGIREYYGI